MTGSYSRPFAEYPDLQSNMHIMFAVIEGKRPTLPPTTPQPLVALYTQLVETENADRPSVSEIIEILASASETYTNNVKVGLSFTFPLQPFFCDLFHGWPGAGGDLAFFGVWELESAINSSPELI